MQYTDRKWNELTEMQDETSEQKPGEETQTNFVMTT
jgi:hypothetical protein